MHDKKPVAVIVIPTYNEADIIETTISELCEKTIPSISTWDVKLLIVDDTSPDGTYKIVQALQPKYPNLYLYLNPKKAGIGGAYIAGFRYAMAKLKADVLIEFDSDLQHPPETIPVLLGKIAEGYDYVLGSRKIPGGSNPKGWGFKRLFFSEIGGLTARFILFFPFSNFFKITDPTTGLKASRVKGFVDQMDMDHLFSRQFGYKLEFLFQMMQLKARVAEIPLQFGLRTTGESKIQGQTAKDILRTVIYLRWHDPFVQKFLKFGVVGGFGFVVNIVGAQVFKPLLLGAGLNISLVNSLSNALAAELSIISNFIGNNLWTFSGQTFSKIRDLLAKFATFNLSSVVTGILIPSAVIGVLTALFGDHLVIYQVLAIFGLTVPLNWLVYTKVIWKK